MSEIHYENPEHTLKAYAAMSESRAIEDRMPRITPDPSKSKRVNSFDELLQEFYSSEEISEMRALAATQTVGHELTSMRITSGISQKMMAAALGVSQPRISAIETAPNARISLQSIQKYVEVTRLPFKATLEDGSVLSVSLPSALKRRPRRKKAEACA